MLHHVTTKTLHLLLRVSPECLRALASRVFDGLVVHLRIVLDVLSGYLPRIPHLFGMSQANVISFDGTAQIDCQSHPH
jgi:hypothetical protein